MTAEALILLALFLPLAGALGIALAHGRPNLREAVSLATAAGLALAVWSLLPEVMAGARPAVELMSLMPGLAIRFAVEPLGALFAALASLLWIVNTIYSIGYMRGNGEQHQTRFYILFAIALFATIGIAFAGNLLTLFVFYEILTLSTYPLVAHKGDPKSVASARVYLGVLLATSIGLLLPAIIWTWQTAGTLEFTPDGILDGRISGPAAGLLLALFMFGTGKAALMPVHRWLPAAMVAPTPVSALLHAVAVVKAGVFVVTKLVVYVFGVDFLQGEASAEWLLYAAGFTTIAASVVALRQDNLKRMLAYSTVAQLSYVTLAAALFRPVAEVGAALHIAAHGLGKITLFFAAGSIYTAARKTEISQLDGIARRMPWTFTAFTIGALAMIGLPPTAGFISKWQILMGSLEAGAWFAVAVLVVSTALNAAYFLPIVHRAWFRAEPAGPTPGHGEAPWPVVLALTVTAVLTLAFFFCHRPVLELAWMIVGGAP
ncbi:MAG: monovalent cation/H+ antiporter subunit D family protein [Pseudomonadota bacterium]|nr:monovalent cation/H+ antiporter subunit D family protein [Pseudomonadota bacterium]